MYAGVSETLFPTLAGEMEPWSETECQSFEEGRLRQLHNRVLVTSEVSAHLLYYRLSS